MEQAICFYEMLRYFQGFEEPKRSPNSVIIAWKFKEKGKKEERFKQAMLPSFKTLIHQQFFATQEIQLGQISKLSNINCELLRALPLMKLERGRGDVERKMKKKKLIIATNKNPKERVVTDKVNQV